VVHPFVKDDFENWVTNRYPKKILFIESAILYESNFDKLVDKVILITASEDIRIERVVKRDGISHEHVKARMSHQIPEDKKLQMADFIIHSDDNEPLEPKMKKIITQLIEIREKLKEKAATD